MRDVTITRNHSLHTGMALVLLLLLAYLEFGGIALLGAAIVVQVLDMVAPQVFRPLAPLWFGLAHVLGAIVSRILLSLVFGLVVTPIGLLRRALGKDSLRLRAFKASDESVMLVRSHTFIAGDLEKPY